MIATSPLYAGVLAKTSHFCSSLTVVSNTGGNQKGQLLIPHSSDNVQVEGNETPESVLDPQFTIHPFCRSANS